MEDKNMFKLRNHYDACWRQDINEYNIDLSYQNIPCLAQKRIIIYMVENGHAMVWFFCVHFDLT